MFKATLILFLVLCLLLCGCSPSIPELPEGTGLIAEPHYPEMAPYPDEMAFVNEQTGEFDSDGFDKVYTAWREDRMAQQNQPEGYADSLQNYFLQITPQLLSGTDTGNKVCSPVNVYMALALLAEITDGDSRQQILNLLNAPDIASLRTQASQVWNAHYCADSASACTLANSLWLSKGLSYQQSTVDILKNHYYASTFQGALGSDEMNDSLRSWLNRQTGGLLEDQIGDLQMDPDTVLALASTIYYRAKWVTEFSESRNTEDIFRSPDADLSVTYMNETFPYGPYFWGEDFGAVSLSLEDDSRMWLILPDEGLTPADLLVSGHALSFLMKEPGSSENQKSMRVNLSLPKFDVFSDLPLADAMQSLGMTAVFDPENADFTPILPEDPAWLDSASHAARVKIDETGVEAAAYTVMMACGAAMPPEDEIDFILNRPFLFCITSRDGLPLFAGIVNTP